MIYLGRSTCQKLIDFAIFPIRALTTFGGDKWGLSALSSERFDYVAREVRGYCLDVGCGRYNRFINQFLKGDGRGIDVFPYEGLTEENLVTDITQFPFPDESFGSITFIACFSHIPRRMRDVELAEAFRCVKPEGNVIVTEGHPFGQILVHWIVRFYDRYFGTNYDVDGERGMDAEEAYYVHDSEIIERITRAGFKEIIKKYFWTQWGLNHMLIGWKRP